MSHNISNSKKLWELQHKRRINWMIDVNRKTVGKENKVKVMIELYKYLIDNIDFVNNFPSIKNVAVNKCYQFKSENPEQTQFIEYLDRFLTKINKPLSVRRSKRIANNPRVKYY